MDNSLFHGGLVSAKRIIYTASDFAKNSLFYLQEAGVLQATKIHESKRTKLNSFLFFVVLSGSGYLYYHNKSRKLKKGDCVFIDCSEDYIHKTSQDLWALKWVHFNSETMSNIYKKYVERGGNNVIHSNHVKEFETILDSVLSIAESKDYIKDMEINEKLVSLMTMIMRESIRRESQKELKASIVEKVKDYLNSAYVQNITLDKLSNIFYINKYYLSRVFKSVYGTTIDNYLLQLRINKSKELLRFTDLSMLEISQTIGFQDQNYFSRVFKLIEGCSPTKYRSSWKS